MTRAPSQDEAHAAIKAILKKHSVLAKDKEAQEDLIYDILEYIAKFGQAFRNVGYEADMDAATNLANGITATILGEQKESV